jgi:hypothetical protein
MTMSPKLQKLGMIAASLVMVVATGLSVAADQPKPQASRSEDLLLAYQTFEKGSRPNGTAASDLHHTASVQDGRHPVRSEEISAAGSPVLPEPGNWSMVLVGLLGVGAIARRRMSA